MKKIFILVCLFLSLLVSACGKSARPSPYPDSGYPHTYPYEQ